MKTALEKEKPDQLKLLLELYHLEAKEAGIDKAVTLERIKKHLDPALLKRFVKLKERKGTAVAILKNGVCSGCNIEYPETHDVVRYENFIHTCEFCGRFLIVDDEEVPAIAK